MKRSIILSILYFITLALYAKYNVRSEMVEMRDGIRLNTLIFEPTDSLEHPILLHRTCYGINDYNNQLPQNYSIYQEHNYILVFQDVRGKNFSEGIFENIRPYIKNKNRNNKTDEASDTYDTAEWLTKNTHSNGNIGIVGCSYPGFYTMMGGLSGHPAVKAISPQAPVTDWFRGDDLHHNGAFFLASSYTFPYWFQYINTKDVALGLKTGMRSPSDTVYNIPNNLYDAFLKLSTIKNLTEIIGDSIDIWNICTEHPNLDKWWKNHSIIPSLKNIKPAVLVVGGLFDAEDCYGALTTYRTICKQSPKTKTYLVEGPWSHGGWMYNEGKNIGEMSLPENSSSNYFYSEIEYPFFAYYLENIGEEPRYKTMIYNTGINMWQTSLEDWTEKKHFNNTLFLNSNKELSIKPQKNIVSTYTSNPENPVPYYHTLDYGISPNYMVCDQSFATKRADVVSFYSEHIKDTIPIIGAIEVNLDVQVSTTDADFIVKIIDVDSEGKELLIRADVLRSKYRKSFSKPYPLNPDKTEHISFKLNDIAHYFLPGHRIMVQVQSSWFPLVDRNPQKFCNIYKCDESDFLSSEIKIMGTSCIRW